MENLEIIYNDIFYLLENCAEEHLEETARDNAEAHRTGADNYAKKYGFYDPDNLAAWKFRAKYYRTELLALLTEAQKLTTTGLQCYFLQQVWRMCDRLDTSNGVRYFRHEDLIELYKLKEEVFATK